MRSRNIKPGFFLNEKLAECDFKTRLLFIGLWCYADREGRFEWIPKRIEAAIFPYDKNVNVEKCLCNLMSLHLITSYTHSNVKVGYIENFVKHQKPHPHEAQSTLPEKLVVSPSEQRPPLHAMTCNDIVGQCRSDIINDDIRKEDIINNDIMIPQTSLAFLWNAVCVSLPKVISLSDKRKRQEKLRLSERTIEKWKDVFTKLNTSEFCKGNNNTGWKATYDWIVSNTDNALKVLEGKYDGKIGRGKQPIACEEAKSQGKYANIKHQTINTDTDNPGNTTVP